MLGTRWWKRTIATRDASAPALSLALQGGGAHGAYTWGVLDRLLEDGWRLDGISGTSAGAMNAVALAQGWTRGHWIQYEAPDAFNAALTRILEAGRTARGRA